MRLTAVTLRHYRIHREITVEFDPARTLIGGPNEAGKSTLVEAIHRALFLRAKGGSEQHRAMESARHGGKPEVELVFEQAGTTYRLHKRFSGASGSVMLTPAGRPALSGDAGEEALARLCAVETGAHARVCVDFWSHLWTWQGTAGEDPAKQADRQKDALLQRLGQAGGAANLIQSERDARVAATIAAARLALFTQRGEPKANTDLARANEETVAAQATLHMARERLDRLAQSLTDHTSATTRLGESERALVRLEQDRRENDARLLRLEELQAREIREAHAAQLAQRDLEQRQLLEQDIATLQQRREEASRALAPLSAEAERLVAAREAAQRTARESDREHGLADDHVRLSRRQHEFAVTQLALVEARAQLDELRARAAQILELDTSLAALRAELAQLPRIELAQLQRLRQLEETQVRTSATLQGMATGIEVLSADVPVRVGETLLSSGQAQVLAEETDIKLGTTVHLRLRPGGGRGLQAAREEAHVAQVKLRQALDELTVGATAEAQDVVRRREGLEVRIRTVMTRRDDLGAASLDARLQDLTETVARLEAEARRRRAAVDVGGELAQDLAAARACLDGAAAAVREAESNAARARALREASARQAAAAETAVARSQAAAEEKRRLLAEAEAHLQLMRAQHGSDPARVEQLQRAGATRESAAAQLHDTRRQIAALAPEEAAADRLRLVRAIEETQRARQDAEVRRAVAQRALQTDGVLDPEEDLALAHARLEAALARQTSLAQQARAVQRLDELFRSERQAMSDQFTQPLLDRAAGYLQRIFGPGARLDMQLKDDVFAPPLLIRPSEPGGAVPFASLSGGTREQVAAAVRLAMAEVLAADFGGCLPVVFDDAFAFADPQRVQALQRTLDLAATRGLQVIVVTCSPDDYIALGAKTILLPVPTQPAAAATHASLHGSPNAPRVSRTPSGVAPTMVEVSSETGRWGARA